MLRRNRLPAPTPVTTTSAQEPPSPQHFQRLFRLLDNLKPPSPSSSGMMSWKVEGEEWVRKDDKVTR